MTTCLRHRDARRRPGLSARLPALVWRAVGWCLTGIGVAGIVLPPLPITPFLILAAAAFARGDPRLRRWLVSHPAFGPPIDAWERHRAIPRRAKRMAYAAMAASVALTLAVGAPVAAIAAQTTCLAFVGLFIATRPEGRSERAPCPTVGRSTP